MRMLSPKEGEVILDAGCGGGYFTRKIASTGALVIGLDRSPNGAMIDKHKSLFMRGDARELPFRDETFHKVLLSSVLQMVRQDLRLLEECHRVLRTTGRIILSVPLEYIYVKRLNDMRDILNVKFQALGTGYYTMKTLDALLRRAKFAPLSNEHSPKRVGSFIYEAGLFLWHVGGVRIFSPWFFPLLLPFVYMDRLSRASLGNEIIICAEKK